jgi:hypothetical protein
MRAALRAFERFIIAVSPPPKKLTAHRSLLTADKILQSKSLKKACYMSVAEKMLAFFL